MDRTLAFLYGVLCYAIFFVTFARRPAHPDGTKPQRFRIELPARNGLFLQDLNLLPADGRWLTRSEFTKNHKPLATPPPIAELK